MEAQGKKQEEVIFEYGRKVDISKDEGYDLHRFPKGIGNTLFPTSLTMFGFCCTLATISGGAVLGMGLYANQVVMALLIGCFLLSCFSVLNCFMGFRVRLPIAMISRFAYGNVGSYFPTAATTVTTWLWLALSNWMHASAWAMLFAVGILGVFPQAPEFKALFGWGFMGGLVIITVTMAIAVVKMQGFKLINEVGKWMFIELAVLLVIVYAVVLRYLGGWGALAQMPPPLVVKGLQPYTLIQGIGIAGSIWVVGSIFFSDFVRFGKDWKVPTFAVPLGMMFGGTLSIGIPALTTIGLYKILGDNAFNPLFVATVIGRTMVIFTCLLVIFASWSTDSVALYQLGLNVGNLTLKRVKTSATPLIISSCIFAAMVHFYIGILPTVVFIITILAALLMSGFGVFLADYYIINRMKYPENIEAIHEMPWKKIWNPIAFGCWLVAFVLGFIAYRQNWMVPPMIALLSGGALYTIICLPLGEKIRFSSRLLSPDYKFVSKSSKGIT
jgi:cytosine permease